MGNAIHLALFKQLAVELTRVLGPGSWSLLSPEGWSARTRAVTYYTFSHSFIIRFPIQVIALRYCTYAGQWAIGNVEFTCCRTGVICALKLQSSTFQRHSC